MTTTRHTLLLGILASTAATFAKKKAEQVLQPIAEKAAPPAPMSKTGIGADVAGHPENMPPSELADRAQHLVTGQLLTDIERARVSAPLHWLMGVGCGVTYAFVARRVPVLRLGYGTVAGTALFAATHLSTLPAAGMQHPPTQMPLAWWGWEGGSHLVYGTVLDTTLRLADHIPNRTRAR